MGIPGHSVALSHDPNKKLQKNDGPAGLTLCRQGVLLGNSMWSALLMSIPIGECIRGELAIAGWVAPDSP